MKATVEIRYKVMVTDKKNNYKTIAMQIPLEEGLAKKINKNKVEKYFECGGAITIPLPNSETIEIYIS